MSSINNGRNKAQFVLTLHTLHISLSQKVLFLKRELIDRLKPQRHAG